MDYCFILDNMYFIYFFLLFSLLSSNQLLTRSILRKRDPFIPILTIHKKSNPYTIYKSYNSHYEACPIFTTFNKEDFLKDILPDTFIKPKDSHTQKVKGNILQ